MMKMLGKQVLAVVLGCGVISSAAAAPVACVTDQSGHAVLQGTPDPKLSELLRASPKGGSALFDAVVALLSESPDRAAEVVALANGANRQQEAALAQALGSVAETLSKTQPATSKAMLDAARCGSPLFRAALAAWRVKHRANDPLLNNLQFQSTGTGTGFRGNAGSVSPN